MTRLSSARRWVGPLLLAVVVGLLIVACVPGQPGTTPGPSASPTPNPASIPLQPAQPTDPFNVLSWLFTPIFQALFIVLVAVYYVLHEVLGVPGAIGIAIVALTLIVRTILIPPFRRQLVSQRRMQMLQPELNEIKKRFKGDAMKVRVAQQELMRERGVSLTSGCLPMLLTLPLLIVIYAVIQNGITNYNPTQMLTVAGIQLVPLECPPAPVFDTANHLVPCIAPVP